MSLFSMCVRVDNTAYLTEDTVAAYCRYNNIDRATTGKMVIANHIRSTLEQIGTLGFYEQVHEGRDTI